MCTHTVTVAFMLHVDIAKLSAICILLSSFVIPVQPSALCRPSALAVWSLQEFLSQSVQVKNYLILEANTFLIPKKMIMTQYLDLLPFYLADT